MTQISSFRNHDESSEPDLVVNFSHANIMVLIGNPVHKPEKIARGHS